jgi:serine/threonine-protein kinase HipA
VSQRRAAVSIDGRRVGTLVESESRSEVTFFYNESYRAAPGAVPVSLTLPLDGGPWTTAGLHPYFDGLLPEGWLRVLAHAKLRVDENDTFGLLVATGADCIGATEILPDDAA